MSPVRSLFERIWYRRDPLSWLLRIPLLPLSALFCLLVFIRRTGYRHALVHGSRVAVPVIVVGNITVGGTGKTPLVIALVEWLQRQGVRPAVISRGYGRESGEGSVLVTPEMDAAVAGDEPLLISREGGVAVYVGVDRVAAAERALADGGCDLLVLDDGLQHYRLQRDIEIIVVDGERQFGNGLCLPAGPLREPRSRLEEVDAVVVNGGNMHLQPQPLYRLGQPEQQQPLESLAGETVHAVAGIGNPQRFFAMLEGAGVKVVPHPFPDHHQYNGEDFQLLAAGELPLVMTEKDAVKCTPAMVGEERIVWVVPVKAQLDSDLEQRLKTKLERVRDNVG